MAIRTTGLISAGAFDMIGYLQTVALGAALFGMGTGVLIASLVRSSGPALLLSTVSTMVVDSISFAGVFLLV